MHASSTSAADTRAAQAALTRPTIPVHESPDRYLLIDDGDEDITEIMSFLRERLPHSLEVHS